MSSVSVRSLVVEEREIGLLSAGCDLGAASEAETTEEDLDLECKFLEGCVTGAEVLPTLFASDLNIEASNTASDLARRCRVPPEGVVLSFHPSGACQVLCRVS